MVFLRFLNFFIFTFWYGTLLYFTLQAFVLFKALPRPLFGEVQNKLFPTFYLISYLCGGILVVTYHLLHPLKNYVPQDCVRITALCLMLLLSLVQGLWIGPKVGNLRIERQLAEESALKSGLPEDQGKARELVRSFQKAHGISSLVNLLVIAAGTVYLVFWFKETGF